MSDQTRGYTSPDGTNWSVQVMLPDGRHLFIGANNLAGMIDAPVEAHEDKPARASRAAAR